MPVEFIGLIRTRDVSELTAPPALSGDTEIDRNYLTRLAVAHEQNGFDKVLIGYFATAPDGWSVASFAAARTERLGFLLAHRPGFVQPTVAARAAVTVDHLTGGRIAFNIITGGIDADQQRDGDWLDHDTRYQRTDEYIQVLDKVWSSGAPFDFDGQFYKIRGAYSDVKPLQQPRIPIYFSGASGPAVEVGAKHADVYMLWGEPLAAVRERLAAVRAATPPDREVRFSLSLRLILGATEEGAWAKAHDFLERIVALRGGQRVASSTRPGAVGSQRLLDFAAKQETFDKRLWMPIAAATGAGGNTTALVGTPEQVAESLLDYYDAGISTILVRGFDPLNDAITYGREVFPIVREEVAKRDRAAALTASNGFRAS